MKYFQNQNIKTARQRNRKKEVAGFPPQRFGFDPRSNHVGSVVDRVALRRFFHELFGFPYQFAFL
jgi:hypothetical protein